MKEKAHLRLPEIIQEYKSDYNDWYILKEDNKKHYYVM
jgi:hypothetical protein